jgi:hypothetical protein
MPSASLSIRTSRGRTHPFRESLSGRAVAPFFRLLHQLLLERDDFLQRVGVVLPLKLQLAFEIGVALFKPRNTNGQKF